MTETVSEKTRIEVTREVDRVVNLAAIVRHVRMQICEAYYTGGHSAALAALAAGSVRLYRLVLEHELRGDIAHETLWDVASNLTLIEVLGEQAVAVAIDTGPRFFEELEAAA